MVSGKGRAVSGQGEVASGGGFDHSRRTQLEELSARIQACSNEELGFVVNVCIDEFKKRAVPQ